MDMHREANSGDFVRRHPRAQQAFPGPEARATESVRDRGVGAAIAPGPQAATAAERGPLTREAESTRFSTTTLMGVV